MKSYYICHYCFIYITINKSDIKKHFNKKKKCKCLTTTSYEDCKNLSINKKFICNFDIDNLSQSDLQYICIHYNDLENMIDLNYKNIALKEILKKNINLSNEIKETENNKNICQILDKEIENDKNYINNFDNIYYNKEKDKYICNLCLVEYKSKQNMLKHIENTSQCEKYKQRNNLIKNNLEQSINMIKKEFNDKQIFNTYVQNNNNNVQNNNNNTQNNTYNFAMRDFVHEKYDLTHINDSFYEKKDFFIYPNFLRVIMENKKNQNIFFSENEAIIYSDKELNKMSSDKAGYLVLDKLSQSFDQLLNKQDNEAREYYSFITKYYSVLKGQYKHDTIYKEYDVDERRFYYTANSSLFRSRDKYLSKIVTTVNKCNDNARENMNVSIQDIKNIPTINPNIEDYASVRMRYRDLKEKSY
jgi:hypothetical protein